MAIIGTYIDKLAGASLAGLTLTTYPHSLPGSAPDAVLLQPLSISAASQPGVVYSPGGNASLLTVGLHQGSVGGAAPATVAFNAYAFIFHSYIR